MPGSMGAGDALSDGMEPVDSLLLGGVEEGESVLFFMFVMGWNWKEEGEVGEVIEGPWLRLFLCVG